MVKYITRITRQSVNSQSSFQLDVDNSEVRVNCNSPKQKSSLSPQSSQGSFFDQFSLNPSQGDSEYHNCKSNSMNYLKAKNSQVIRYDTQASYVTTRSKAIQKGAKLHQLCEKPQSKISNNSWSQISYRSNSEFSIKNNKTRNNKSTINKQQLKNLSITEGNIIWIKYLCPEDKGIEYFLTRQNQLNSPRPVQHIEDSKQSTSTNSQMVKNGGSSQLKFIQGQIVKTGSRDKHGNKLTYIHFLGYDKRNDMWIRNDQILQKDPSLGEEIEVRSPFQFSQNSIDSILNSNSNKSKQSIDYQCSHSIQSMRSKNSEQLQKNDDINCIIQDLKQDQTKSELIIKTRNQRLKNEINPHGNIWTYKKQSNQKKTQQSQDSHISLNEVLESNRKSYLVDEPEDFQNNKKAESVDQEIFEEHHQEQSKIKYIEQIQLGLQNLNTWYWSPYPKLNSKNIAVCEFCLKYFVDSDHLLKHRMDKLEKCNERRGPPGTRIYHHISSGTQHKEDPLDVHSVSVYLVEGNKDKLYCQNLCLLGKLFLDHKTLYFEVDTFQFYILTENNHHYGTQNIVGYFSRESTLEEDFNLACIMVLPCYQRRGYGRFLISLSYYLSGGIDDKTCTPERPLSEMGAISYKSYWKDTIFEALRSKFKKAKYDITARELSDYTKIQIEDIIMTLSSLNLVKYWRGSYIIKNISQRQIENHFKVKQEKQAKNGQEILVFDSTKIVQNTKIMLKSVEISKKVKSPKKRKNRN